MVLNVHRNHKAYMGWGEKREGGDFIYILEREREYKRDREYNKVQTCFVLETFYSEFSPFRALSRPAWSA